MDGDDTTGPDATVVTVEDLVRPLSFAEFFDGPWTEEEFFISGANRRLVDAFRSVPALRSVDALLPKLHREVRLFGPNAFRSSVPPSRARDFYEAGHTLYIQLAGEVPEAEDLLARAASELGFTRSQIGLEIFAGRAGAVSSYHYDHDVNFQILLGGKKRWTYGRNTNIRNPRFAYHPRRTAEGRTRGFLEEAVARDPRLPTGFDADAPRADATAGTVVFLPRGYWHEVHAITDCFGINLVLKGRTWAEAVAGALRNRLELLEEHRAYLSGLRTSTTRPEVARRAEEHLQRIKKAAIETIEGLTLDEVALCVRTFVEWSPQAASRRLVPGLDRWELHLPDLLDEPAQVDPLLGEYLERLVALEDRFCWQDTLAFAGRLSASNVAALITQLVEADALIRTSSSP